MLNITSSRRGKHQDGLQGEGEPHFLSPQVNEGGRVSEVQTRGSCGLPGPGPVITAQKPSPPP